MLSELGEAPGLRAALERRAHELGFAQCRVVSPDAIPPAGERLGQWLAEGAHGDMAWMADTFRRRADPRVLWPDVRSIVVLALDYGPDEDPLATLRERTAANISVYARHRDYHDVLKGKLKQLAGWLARAAGGEVKVFVDTAPVMEKPLAAAAGVGWQGKHTNLVSRGHGSWLFLGTIFTTLDLAPDAPACDNCGSCTACLDICPTAAFPAPYRLDARRCLSYLTIEHEGHIAAEFRAPMGNRVYGCDDCLAVCPWNKFASAACEAKLTARDDLRRPALADLASLNDAGFRARFSGSPVKRIGSDRFLRNVMIAVGNAGDPSLRPIIVARLGHPSPLVRAMAVWAAGRAFEAADLAALAETYRDRENDPAVLAEWEALLPTNEAGPRT